MAIIGYELSILIDLLFLAVLGDYWLLWAIIGLKLVVVILRATVGQYGMSRSGSQSNQHLILRIFCS